LDGLVRPNLKLFWLVWSRPTRGVCWSV
jgi:hypothetical protein